MAKTEKIGIIVDIGAEISSAKSEIVKLSKMLQSSTFDNGINKEITEIISKLEQMEKQVGKTFTSKNESNSLIKDFDKIQTSINQVNKKIQEASKQQIDWRKTLPEKEIKILDELVESTEDYQKKLKALRAQETALNQTRKETIHLIDDLQKKQSQKNINSANKAQLTADKSILTQEKKKLTNAIAKRQSQQSFEDSYIESHGNKRGLSQAYSAYEQETQNLKNKLVSVISSLDEIDTKLNTIKNEAKIDYEVQISNAQSNLAQIDEDIESIVNQQKESETISKQLKETWESMGFSPDVVNESEKLKDTIEDIATVNTQKAVNEVKNIGEQSRKATLQTELLGDSIWDIGDKTSNLGTLRSDVEQLTRRFTDLFSLTAMGNAFIKAIRNSYASIKELDKAMTETAVVTDFSVGDMWDKLPDYTEQANNLGVATVEAYEAATLYYQQGLKTAEVNSLTTSTLKMARIASLDAATATDRMTNALRGFNMELNETSAERVADVYSELAAVSATDVNELSVAMTKTASIANSANMSFENTAAYLAQMLETTRESAETAGTALKTVIGRFTEVKELYTKGQLTGTDDEGEAIDVNKVSKALRTAGIDMNKFFIGEVGLDEIFNELAEKWDSLSIVQQRYIATQAAGSRQQSRFIAMLGDQNRLLQLQNSAYNASGASQRQYEKTMESLETKLTKLKNAWNQFTMTLMNSDAVKAGIDVLTFCLNKINDIISAISGGNGLIASIAALSIALTGVWAIIKINMKYALKKSIIDTLTSILSVGIPEAVEKSTPSGIAASIAAGAAEGTARGEAYIAAYETMVSGASATNEAGEAVKGAVDNLDNGIKDAGATTVIGKILSKIFKKSGTEAGKTAGEGASKGFLKTIKSSFTKTVIPAITELFAGIGTAGLVAGGAIAAAAVATVGYGIYKIYDNLPTTKLKEFQAAAEGAQTAAEKLSEAYNELSTTAQEYDSIINDISEITEGTQEWAEKLLEVNSLAGELLKLYPNLKYTIGSNGLINIDSESLQNAVEQAQQKAINAQSASNTAYAISQEEEFNVNNRRGIFSGSSKYASDIADKLKNNMISGNDLVYLTDRIASGDISNEAGIKEAVDSFINRKYAGKLEKTDTNKDREILYEELINELNDKNSINAQNQAAILSTINSNISSQLNDSYKKDGGQGSFQYTSNFGELMADNYKKSVKDAADEILSDNNTNTKDKIKEAYKKELELTDDDIEEIESDMESNGRNTKEAWAEMLAAYKESAKLAEEAQKIYDGVKTVSKDNKSAPSSDLMFKSLNDNEGVLSQAQIGQIKSLIDDDDLLKRYSEATDISSDKLKEILNKQIELSKQENEATNDLINKIFGEGQGEKFLSNQGADIRQTAADVIGDISVSNGKEKAQEISKYISNIFNSINDSLTESEIDNFESAFNAVDWNNWESAHNFANEIDNLENVSDDTRQYLKKLTNEVIDLGYAAVNCSIDELGGKINDINSLIEDIENRDIADRVFDEETYNKLLSYGMSSSDFVYDGTNYTYIGESLSSIISILQEMAGKLGDSAGQNYAEPVAQVLEKNGITNETKYSSDSGEKEKIKKAVEEAYLAMGWDSEDVANLISLLGDNEEKWNTTLNGLNDIANSMALSSTTDYEQQSAAYMQSQNYSKLLENESNTNMEANADQKTLDAAILTTEGATKNLFDLTKQLDTFTQKQKEATSETLKYDNVLKVLSLTQKKEEKQVDKLLEKTGDYFSAIEDGGDLDATFEKMANAAKELFGESIDDQWVLDNIDKFKALVSGDAQAASEAYNSLQQDIANKATQNILNNYKSALYEGYQETQSIANAINDISATVDLYGTADITDIINKFIDLKKLTADQIDQLQQYLSQASGTKIQFVTEYEWTGDPAKAAAEGYTQVAPGAYKKVKQIRAVATSSVTGGGSNYKGFGGGGSKGSKGSGGSSSKEKDPFEDSVSKLYNWDKKIAELQRERNNLEKEFSLMQEDEVSNAQALYKNLKQREALLKKEQSYTQSKKSDAEKYFKQYMNGKASKYSKYFWFDENANAMQVNHDAIQNIKDADFGKEVEEALSNAELYLGNWQELEADLIEIKQALEDLENTGRDEFLELENEIVEALIKERQDEIDAISNVSDSIDEANDKLMDSIDKAISKQRQDRENEKTEKEITDKQQRLAYLQMDTSGANQVEILNLQKEINDAQENYTDQLIDQKINELKEQNEAASEQRQAQIELMQASLDYSKDNTDVFKQKANEIIGQGLNIEGKIIEDTTLWKLLTDYNDWAAMSKTERDKFKDQWTNTADMAELYRKTHPENTGSGNNKSGSGSTTNKNGGSTTNTTTSKNTNSNTGYTSKYNQQVKVGVAEAIWRIGDKAGWGNGKTRGSRFKEKFGEKAAEEIQAYINQIANGKVKASQIKSGDLSKYYYTKFATGGLNTTTGPAWLDGTKSKPEYVLNASQTQGFLRLVDVLDGLKNGNYNTQNSSSYGDQNFEINISVDKIANDYDVEKLAKKLKKEIYQDSTYRNFNNVSRLR